MTTPGMPTTFLVSISYVRTSATFLIDTNKDADSSDKYTLQLINYYSLGESGTPEIRFKKVSAQ